MYVLWGKITTENIYYNNRVSLSCNLTLNVLPNNYINFYPHYRRIYHYIGVQIGSTPRVYIVINHFNLIDRDTIF